MKQMLTHTHTQENKKWEIKTWEKWYWGIVEVLLIVVLTLLVYFDNDRFGWKDLVALSIVFLLGNIVFLIIWGITKLIIWLVNRNSEKKNFDTINKK